MADTTLVALRIPNEVLAVIEAEREPGQTRTDAIVARLTAKPRGKASKRGSITMKASGRDLAKAAASRPRRAKAGMPGHSETCKCGACKSMRGE